MKIIVIGANGMLGSDLTKACRHAGIDAHGFDLPELDICQNLDMLDQVSGCNAVINCAAYTNVDGAEADMETAFAVNCDGAANIAEWCSKKNLPVIYISTDYVFYGSNTSAHKEDDPVNPPNVYGDSKLAGEMAIKSIYNDYLIIRTQSLYGVNGRNFVKTIMSYLENNDEPLKVVNDQVSSPTYTVHLADAILRLLKTKKRGIVHVAATNSCTWHEFACAIAKKVKPDAKVMPVSTEKYSRPARRPAYSVFDTSRYQSWTGHKMPSWEEGLGEYLREWSMVDG
ncbi:dTDP-4-dehydrorhamnose reductase [Verrucomicrobiota bacterium]